MALLLLSLGLGGIAWAMQRNRRVALTFAVLMLVALGTAACGSLAKGPSGATPPGTYSLTLTTTFNGQTQTLANFLTLVVQ
jgi:ABC-type glycerol-3-phosphate transport system substrate-binding protein